MPSCVARLNQKLRLSEIAHTLQYKLGALIRNNRFETPLTAGTRQTMPSPLRRIPMDLILIIVLLVLLFGGGGYWGRRRGHW